MLIQILNAVAAATTVAAALVALTRPSLLSDSPAPSPGETFYARMYTARAVPLGIVAGVLPWLSAGLPVRLVLGAAALAQIGDVLLAVGRHAWPMLGGAALAAVVHAAAAWLI